MTGARQTVLRVAARGDGLTDRGEYVARAAPGDWIDGEGRLHRGEHYVEPPCRHFGACGACQLQHLDEASLRDFVRERVLLAAKAQRIEAEETLDCWLAPEYSRRRASLHAHVKKSLVRLGFREARAHRVVDLDECHVLDPQLFALVAPLRQLIGEMVSTRGCEIALTRVDQGIECVIGGLAVEGLGAREALIEFARRHRLARLAIDDGYGVESFWEPEPVSVTLSGIAVGFPFKSFLQASAEAEALMVADAKRWLASSTRIADLFAGLGTFGIALCASAKVDCFEGARDASLALAQAAARHRLTLQAHHRDLFRNPLDARELAQFDAVLLDPPRAGARAQIDQIAASGIERVVYVSCNPASWARDARRLVDAGFALSGVRPIGQFRWSTHVELTSLFTR